MRYNKLTLNNKEFFTAQPETPEELLFTLLEERPFLDYDPNCTSSEPNPEILNMFL